MLQVQKCNQIKQINATSLNKYDGYQTIKSTLRYSKDVVHFLASNKTSQAEGKAATSCQHTDLKLQPEGPAVPPKPELSLRGMVCSYLLTAHRHREAGDGCCAARSHCPSGERSSTQHSPGQLRASCSTCRAHSHRVGTHVLLRILFYKEHFTVTQQNFRAGMWSLRRASNLINLEYTESLLS